jgi:hypothetical protein
MEFSDMKPQIQIDHIDLDSLRVWTYADGDRTCVSWKFCRRCFLVAIVSQPLTTQTDTTWPADPRDCLIILFSKPKD